MIRIPRLYRFFEPRRYYRIGNKTDLPILPRVAFAHKQFKAELSKGKYKIPENLSQELSEILNVIRGTNWNNLNADGIDFKEAQKGKEKLQRLIDIKNRLPDPLASELETAFTSLEGAIECLDQRAAPIAYK